jgi:hypothetical protein
MADRGFLRRPSDKLYDEGRLIEAGWISNRSTGTHPDAATDQLDQMRLAYMEGAMWCYVLVAEMLDADAEPTAATLRLREMIEREFDAFSTLTVAPGARKPGSGI